MKNSTLLVAAGLAIAPAVFAVLPVACSGGGGGGLGLGIATLGVSALFPANSPGFCAIDRNHRPVDGTPSTVPATNQDPIVIGPGETVGRAIVPGGFIFNPVTVAFTASATAQSTITLALAHHPWDAVTAATTLAQSTAPNGTTSTAVSRGLDFTTIRR